MTEVRRRGRPGQAEPVAQKGAQALERGIAILQYLEKSGGSSSVSDISLNLDLPLSTTFRLLKVLQAADFVYQDSAMAQYEECSSLLSKDQAEFMNFPQQEEDFRSGSYIKDYLIHSF